MNYEQLLLGFDISIIKMAKAHNIPPLEWEDICQELRLKLWENRASYDPNKGSYENWAYIICNRKLIDLMRHYSAKKRAENKKTSLNELLENGWEI